MGKFFCKKFAPLVHIQNDQLVMGIILRYVCWGTHRTPPPPIRGARQSPSLQPPKWAHTPRGHTMAGGGPRGLEQT